MAEKRSQIRGRGTNENPPNRFETLWFMRDPDPFDPEEPNPNTHFLKDTSHSIITTNDSPDVGFDASINPYRGCEHGCIYCYARPTHEYLGFSAGLDFETKILVKETAPALLRQELTAKKWRPQVLAISGVTDPYQPVEKHLALTRGCLQVLAEFRNPVVVVTKNFLVTRDVDLLGELAQHHAAAVFVSVTTLDGKLSRIMEPRASQPHRRLEAIRTLSAAGVPTGVMVAPVVPGLTDHELPAIVKAAREAGAESASYVVLRLPHAVKHLFEPWLSEHYPHRKEKVMNRIRGMRGGGLNDPRFGTRMKGEGIFADQIASLFVSACRRAGMPRGRPELSTSAFKTPHRDQLRLFS